MLAPEIEFILYCSRTKIKPELAARLKNILSVKLDWTKIIRLSKINRTASLLYYNISSPNFIKESIPKEKLLELKNYYYTTLQRNVLSCNEFSRILDRFYEKNIGIIPLKGIILGDVIYSDIALRPYQDIDILVHKNDLPAAITVLEKMGYENAAYFDFHIIFVKDDIKIELHWLLTVEWLNKINTEELWQRSREHEINGKQIRMLSNEDTIISLIIQVRYEINPFFLYRFCDIHEVIEKYKDSLDWDCLLMLSKKYQFMNPLLFTLAVCRQYLHSQIPEKILRKLRQKSIKRKWLYAISKKPFLPLLLIEGDTSKKSFLWINALKILMADKITETLKIVRRAYTGQAE